MVLADSPRQKDSKSVKKNLPNLFSLGKWTKCPDEGSGVLKSSGQMCPLGHTCPLSSMWMKGTVNMKNAKIEKWYFSINNFVLPKKQQKKN